MKDATLNVTKDVVFSPGNDTVPGTVWGQPLDPDSPKGRAAQRIYDLNLCHKCGKRKGTQTWGDMLAMTHGGGVPRCDICVYTAQLEHAVNRTRAIPRLLFLWFRAILKDHGT
jgi:hypothetical protein